MTSVMLQPKPPSGRPLRLALGAAVVGTLFAAQAAQAAGTDAGTSVTNRATVSYSVNSVAQTPIESSPTGNGTPGTGAGADTTFLVDRRINFTVAEVGGAATTTSPGATGAVTTFSVTNTTNGAQGFALGAVNLANGTVVFGNTDNRDVTIANVFVDANGNGSYDPGTDTATSINSLAEDTSVAVFVVANVPLAAVNGDFSNVRLTATAAVPGTNGGTLEVATVGAESPTVVDVVFADTDRDGLQAADDQYALASAALSVAKGQVVVSDPLNGTTNPKALPDAIVEYTITLTNTGTVAATAVSVADPLNAALALEVGANNVTINDGTSRTCTAEAGPDANSDGCWLDGNILRVNPTPAIGVGVAPANTSTVTFRARIL